jgi:hybrid cluster-associated redox disulfide protein
MKEVTMEHARLATSLTVADVLARWPQTIPIFLRYRMVCVGCPIAPFETLAEVAAIYDLDLNCFLSELEQVVQLTERI